MSEDGGFELTPPPGGFTAAGLSRWLSARGMDFSDQAVRNWARRGMPHRRDHPDAAAMFPDPEACLLWIRGNVPEAGLRRHGGKRAGAGRPSADRSGQEQDRRRGETLDAAFALGEEFGTHRAEVEAAVKAGRTVPLDVKRAGDPEYVAMLASLGVPATAFQNLEQIVKLQQRQLDLEQARGRLIDRQAAYTEVSDYVLVLKSHLDALPEKVARELIAELALPGERAVEIRRAVTRLVRAVESAMADLPMAPEEDAVAA